MCAVEDGDQRVAVLLGSKCTPLWGFRLEFVESFKRATRSADQMNCSCWIDVRSGGVGRLDGAIVHRPGALVAVPASVDSVE